MKDKPRLGRGLDALFGDTTDPGRVTTTDQAVIPVDRIEHNPFQPRKTIDEDELANLSASIRTHGILQPLVVRRHGERYQLVAGERRLRAAQAAGLLEVPVRIVDFNDQQILEAALVENIQRTDLNPIEKAQGFKDYLDRFQMTHEQLAARLGLARPTITNLVSLLELPAEVQEAVRLGQITLGHAKILKSVSDPARMVALCREIIARNCSVRETEMLVKQDRNGASEPAPRQAKPAEPPPEKTAHVIGLENELRQRLATKVEIRLRAKDRGQIVLTFESNDDFERLLEILRR